MVHQLRLTGGFALGLLLVGCGGGGGDGNGGTEPPASPQISNVSCTNPTTNKSFECTASGHDLPSGLSATLGDTTCTQVSVSTTQAVFSCEAGTAGDYTFLVRDGSSVVIENTGTSSVTVSLAAAFLYQALPIADATSTTLLAQLNAEGAKGYKFWGPLNFASQTYGIFIKDTVRDTTYTYKSIVNATSAADFVTKANTEGNNGYAYWGDYYTADASTSSYFEKDAKDSGVYAYKTLPRASDLASFLTQANTQGASGYRFRTDLFVGLSLNSFYVKNTNKADQFVYKANAAPTTASALVTQANAEGVDGYRYRGNVAYINGSAVTTSAIYLKNTTQNSVFSYTHMPAQNTSGDFVAAMNPEGENGFVYLNDLAFSGDGTTSSVLMDLSHCNGDLCRYSNPLSLW